MNKQSAKLSNAAHKVSLLLGVYALHLFLFVGLAAFSHPSFTGFYNAGHPADNSGTNRDPASVECRSLFKYDDSKQIIASNSLPESIVLNTNTFLQDMSVSGIVTSALTFKPTYTYSKLYCLFGVFLI